MEEQVKSTVKKCYFQIRSVAKMRKYVFLLSLTLTIVMPYFMVCLVAYCINYKEFKNIAAKLVSCIHKSAHISPV